MESAIAAEFLRWTCVRAALSRGYWIVTALYLVVIADLTPFELVLIGTFQGLTVLIAEVPAGVLADAVSRRLSLVIGHVVMGIGMSMAGLVTAFPLLVVSQCLWGLGWAFSSGADVAWLTDELDRPDMIDTVLVAQARWDLIGTPIGIASFGMLAWASTLSTAIVVSGGAMVLLGTAVVARWPEAGFRPAKAGHPAHQSAAILRPALALVRVDRVILGVIIATMFVNGSAEAYGRLLNHRLVSLGMPTHPDPIVWFAAVSLLGVGLGAVALRAVEVRIAGAGVAARTYVLSCGLGVVGLLLFANAPNIAAAVAGSALVSGIALPVIRTAGVVLVNRRVTSAVRATVHSLLSQAENAGEIIFGLSLALLARAASTMVALTGSAALLAVAAGFVSFTRENSPPPSAQPRRPSATPDAPTPPTTPTTARRSRSPREPDHEPLSPAKWKIGLRRCRRLWL
jgi:MFS family permease